MSLRSQRLGIPSAHAGGVAGLYRLLGAERLKHWLEQMRAGQAVQWWHDTQLHCLASWR